MSIDQPCQAPTTEELLGLPIDRLPEAIIAVAERLATGSVGLYVVDLEGVALRRLAGGFSMPEEMPIPQMPGPELPAGHLEELERSFAARGLGTVVPLWLRHRAIAVFVVDGSFARELEEFAARAAVALELSLRYTDRVARARHRQQATAGAELQQLLLPPRIAGFRGGASRRSTGRWITRGRRHPHGSRDRRLRRLVDVRNGVARTLGILDPHTRVGHLRPPATLPARR
jgi:hypothetical protein